jgi:hypothetical protein
MYPRIKLYRFKKAFHAEQDAGTHFFLIVPEGHRLNGKKHFLSVIEFLEDLNNLN